MNVNFYGVRNVCITTENISSTCVISGFVWYLLACGPIDFTVGMHMENLIWGACIFSAELAMQFAASS
jgi:hypothetical protein